MSFSKCKDCGQSMYIIGKPVELCAECKWSTESDEWDAEDRRRCPYCAHVEGTDEEWELHEEGCYEMNCEECGKDYTVSVTVSRTLTSPELEA